MSAASVQRVNQDADVIGQQYALAANISAANGLASILKTNLGPKGTLKMLVSGAGDIMLTKDGKCLLDQMQIQHPTALLIARTATAQDTITGDGTTSNVLFIGELLRQAERHLSEGLHPRFLAQGFELAQAETVSFLDEMKHSLVDSKTESKGDSKESKQVFHHDVSRELLVNVAQTSLRTKLYRELADHLTEIVVNSVLCIRKPNMPIDLHMVEIMYMSHGADMDTKFVDGLVLDHGARHPNMAKRVEKAFIFVCNVSLEYEKSMVNAGFFYKNAEEREAMVTAERKYTDDKVHQLVEFKNRVCDGTDMNFVLINQKGIDPPSLDILQRNGIVALRRAKRRNMERLALACGGYAVNSFDELKEDCLGYADLVYEHVLGDDKYTIVEGCKNPTSCTILVKGPNAHTIRQIKDAIRDGLRAVTNVLEDGAVVPGAGCFEVMAHQHLLEFKNTVQGRAKLGVQAFADALLVIPKTLASNAGLDLTETVIKLLDEVMAGNRVGLDIDTGECMDPEAAGIWDNYRVKKQLLHLGSMIAQKLLLVDEIIRAGRNMGKK